MSAQPYRIPAPRPDPYGDAWAHLRRRRLARRLAIGIFVHAIGTAMVFALNGANFRVPYRGSSILEMGVALVGVFLLVTLALARYLVPFVCPRCDQPFFHGLITEIGFTKHCVNCDLEVDTPTPLSEERGRLDE